MLFSSGNASSYEKDPDRIEEEKYVLRLELECSKMNTCIFQPGTKVERIQDERVKMVLF